MLWALVRGLLCRGGGRASGAPPGGSAAGSAAGKAIPGADTPAGLLAQAESLAKAGRLSAALERYRACKGAYPELIDARLGAAAVLVDLWSIEEAIAAYAEALALAPAAGALHSALLFHSHYRSPADARALFDLHVRYGATMKVAQRRDSPGFGPAQEPRRRLRIGYVSPNFSRHSVGYFIEPVVRCHDRRQFEVFCYYSHHIADDTTQRMRGLADAWRDVAGVPDDALERMIRADRVDILVDLAGHSKGNALNVVARRPAPVQFTWLGYPDTTGLDAVDWRITDNTADPASGAEARHTESLLRIDGCFLCYQPPADAPPVVARAPSSAVVFASFNNLAKLNTQTIRLWAEILAAVPGSRLVLKAATLRHADTVERLLECFESCGLDASRVDLRGWIDSRRSHLEAYEGIDIALDTFPYNGTTTTCEALWMGVPVVTRAGEVHMSRVGASILHCAGLGGLVADSDAGYVERAVALARDPARRASLRSGMRERLARSPLLDHAGFTRKLETHYRQTWEQWCASGASRDPRGPA